MDDARYEIDLRREHYNQAAGGFAQFGDKKGHQVNGCLTKPLGRFPALSFRICTIAILNRLYKKLGALI